jgi:FixJ family two-component response regulator
MPTCAGGHLSGDVGLSITIVFITGHGDVSISVLAKTAAVEFLTRPFRDPGLNGAARSALQFERTARLRQKDVLELRQRLVWLTDLVRIAARLGLHVPR